MIGKTVSHYKIISKLGEGGMGVVYKAEDTRLNRAVALKFLPAQLTHDSATKKRFIREARAASAIQHNNVCTIHEIGETDDGQLYICMEHYEGKTLNHMLADGEITAGSAIDIVIQIADGLSKAHKTGITHRDIKPANILVTSDGIPKLLDFGLARLGADTRVTKTGVTVGTVAYMSPEQARGDEVDARSDVWSLSVVLYELLTGVLPFPGEQSAAVIYGVMNSDPRPLEDYWSGAPERLQYVLERGLCKDKENRFQTAEEFLQELVGIEEQLVGTGKRRRSTVQAGARTRKRKQLFRLGMTAVVLAALAVFVTTRFGLKGPAEAMAIAVMDFNNLSDPEDKVRTAGMAGLLHVGLVQNVSARVVSPDYLRDVGRRLFGAEKGPVEESQVLQVARESGANLMLAGQLGASGDTRYVLWRLVDTRTGETLGASRANGSDALTIADGIVAEVAGILRREFGLGGEVEIQSVSELTTRNPEAHESFVAGILAATEYNWEDAIRHFQNAVGLDSTFALAYLEMARVQHGRGRYGDALASTENSWELRTRLSVKDRMRLEAFRLQLNYKVVSSTDVYRELAARWPDDHDILRDLISHLFLWWSFREALEVSRQAGALFPDDAFFASVPAQALAQLGRTDEALAAEREFVRRFPKRLDGLIRMARRFLEMGMPDSAQVTFQQLLSEKPDNFAAQRAIAVRIPYCRGDLDSALASCERIIDRDDLEAFQLASTREFLKWLCFEAGQYERVLGMFDEKSQKNRVQAFYDDRERVGFLLRMGRGRELLRWSEALEETLRVHAEEVDDPEYLQYMGIARWTCKENQSFALALLDSLDAAEVAADEVFESGQEFGAYAIRSALLVKLQIAIKKKNADEAAVLVEQLEAVGGNVSAWYNRLAALKVDTYKLQGRLDEAEQVLKEHIRVYGGHALSYYKLGQLYEKMNRRDDAVENYRRFLELWSEADEGLPQLVDARERLTRLADEAQ